MKIKTHNSNAQYLNTNHFFILSKGNNAGKPMVNPCPNCFVFLASNPNEKEYYLLGRTVLTNKDTQLNQLKLNISVGQLTAGTYFYNCQKDGKRFISKFIKI